MILGGVDMLSWGRRRVCACIQGQGGGRIGRSAVMAIVAESADPLPPEDGFRRSKTGWYDGDLVGLMIVVWVEYRRGACRVSCRTSMKWGLRTRMSD